MLENKSTYKCPKCGAEKTAKPAGNVFCKFDNQLMREVVPGIINKGESGVREKREW